MAKYRVVNAHHGQRTAVFDEYSRCVELVPARMTDAELAVLIATQDQTGAYVPAQLATQRVFDSSTKEWGHVEWPVEK